MKVLFTGFEPFGGESINPSWEAVNRLPSSTGNVNIVKALLPVEYSGSARALVEAMNRYTPDAVICVGQAGGRKGITIERVAINMDDSTTPDNAGVIMTDTPIRLGGPAAYFSMLPVKKLVKALNDAGYEASVSNSAGTYVCNHIMYTLIDTLSIKMYRIPAGFIHVPFSTEQIGSRDGLPSMPIDDITGALELCARQLI